MKLLIVMSLVLLSGCVQLDHERPVESRRLETAYQVLHAADALQTLDIKNHPGLRETNWFLGDHPTDGKVMVWYMGTAYGHVFITDALEREGAPVWMKRTWQVITIGDAMNAVYGNYQLGLKVSF